MSVELKPCPFCGGKAVQRKSYDNDGFGAYFSYACKECGASSGERYATETCGIFFESLRDAWNTRSDLAVEVKPLEWDINRSTEQVGATGLFGEVYVTRFGGKWFHNGECFDDDIDAAKAAAQADYNARILSALTTRPDVLRPKLQALLSKWEGMTCRTKCAEELREVLEATP